MEQNYRSTQNILGIANALIEHNVQRKPKSLWTEAGNGELAVLYRAEDEHDEAFFVADEIERLRQSEGFRYGDVAIFYRTNAQSRVIEDVLMRVGAALPRRSAASGSTSARRSRTSSAYLRLLVNPQDVISFRRVVNMPKRGIGDATVSARRIASRARRASPSWTPRIGGSTRSPSLAARAKGAVAGFVQVMDALQAPPGRRRGPAADGGVRGAGVRLPGRARGGPHGRGAGSHREPAGAGGRRGRVRGARARHRPGTASWSRSRSWASRTSTTRRTPSSR